LEAEGYTVWPFVIPAYSVDAPHQRNRVWIVAYTNGNDGRNESSPEPQKRQTRVEHRRGGGRQPIGKSDEVMADTASKRGKRSTERPLYGVADVSVEFGRSSQDVHNGWATEPDVGRVANGLPRRSHRIKALGNAVVPQIPEVIGLTILKFEGAKNDVIK
jgi:DNA (cytosine-5)-methyltransferase 1